MFVSNEKQTSLLFLIVLSLLLLPFQSCTSDGNSHERLKLEKGFKMDKFAAGLGSPRFMAYSPDGVLFATIIKSGKVVALPDKNKDGKADKVITFLNGLKLPHGIKFHDGYLYIGETNRIVRYKYKDFKSGPGKREVVVPDLPAGGHRTRTILFDTDGNMYVSTGASCNVCVENDKRRAAIMRYEADGSKGEIFATGLRNSVGMTVNPSTGEIWATDNGRDMLGDDLPPDEINIIKKGNNYGWPYCYGNRVPDPKFNSKEYCRKTTPALLELQAHSAPLGLTFYSAKAFPDEYRGDLFVAYHGSWNRTVPTGYKVVRVKITNGEPGTIQDFISGWLEGGKSWGRPVDVIVGPEGGLYISDDKGGVIYRVYYSG